MQIKNAVLLIVTMFVLVSGNQHNSLFNLRRRPRGPRLQSWNRCGDFILASPIEETLLVISHRDFGKNMTLKCNLKLNPMCKISFVNISWTHNGNTLELSDDKYINQPFQSKIDGDLTIPNFSRDHMGIYQCSVTEPRGTIVAMPINLSEEYISPPRIKMRSKSGYMEPEDFVSLYCAFEYKSPFKPRVLWYKNGIRLSLTPIVNGTKGACYTPNESKENAAMCHDGQVQRVLYLWNVSDINIGNYSCKVYLNTIEKMSSIMKIDFNYVGLSEVNELQKEPLPPSIFHIDSKDFSKYINKKINIFVHCGLPFLKSHNVEWTMTSTQTLKNNKSDSIPLVSYYAGNYLVKLHRGFTDNFYNFTCKFCKTHMVNTSNYDSKIFRMSHTTIITQTKENYQYTGSNIFVLKENNDVSISGLDETFDHTALATLRTWYFNGRIFDASDEHVTIEPDMRTLKMKNITTSQEGYYQSIIVTPFYKYVSTHLVLIRQHTQMFPTINWEIEKVTDDTIYCKIKLIMKDVVFPICGNLVCRTQNFEGRKIINLSERMLSNKSFIEYSLPIFLLSPDTNYSVSAAYKSTYVKGFEASNETYDIKTNKSGPTFCPTFYLAELRSTSAIVKWFPLSSFKRYGKIINHELTWRDPLDGNSTKSILFNASVYQYSIEDLKPGTAYYVTVKSKNSVGFCKLSNEQIMQTIENKTLQFSVEQYIKDLKYNGRFLRWVFLEKAEDNISLFSMHTFGWNSTTDKSTHSIVRIPSTSCVNKTNSSECVIEKPTLLPRAISSLHLKAIKFHNSSSTTVFSKLVYPYPHKVTPYIKLVHACYNHGQTKIFKWTKNQICYTAYQIRQRVFDTNGEEYYKYYPISYDMDTMIWVQQWFDAPLLNISITMDKIDTIQLSCFSDMEGISEPSPVCNNNLTDDSKLTFPPYLECGRLNISNVECTFISNGTITPTIHSFVIKVTKQKYVDQKTKYIIPQFVQYYHYPLTFKNGTASSVQFELKLAAESENSTTLQTASCLSATFCSTWGPVQSFSDVLLANYTTN